MTKPANLPSIDLTSALRRATIKPGSEGVPVRYLVCAMLAAVAVIHLLPLSRALGSDRLALLYGLDFKEPNLAILMRHRAVLFGLLGVFMLVAAFRPAWQAAAIAAGAASVVSFLALAWSAGDYNAQISRVVIADGVALICLVIALAAYIFVQREP